MGERGDQWTHALLTGPSDYPKWKWYMEAFLQSRKLMRVVDGTDLRTAEDGNPDEWDSKNERAISIIKQAIDYDSQSTYLDNAMTAPEMWVKLKEGNTISSLKHIVLLERKLTNLRLAPGADPRPHLQEIARIAKELKELGSEVDPKRLGMILMVSLPEDEWDGMLQSFGSVSRDVLTYDYVKQRMLENLAKTFTDSAATSNAVTGPSGASALVAGKGRSDGCFKCGGLDHYARGCRARRSNQQWQTNSQQDESRSRRGRGRGRGGWWHQSSYAEEESSVADADATDEVALAATTGLVTNRNCWVVDSGASSHMSPHGEYLQNYQSFGTPQVVTLGDHYAVSAIGKGDLPVMIGDIAGRMYDVLHVPDLRVNLFSTSAMASKGEMSAYFDHNGCEVLRGGCNGHVLAKAGVMRGLHVLRLPVRHTAARLDNDRLMQPVPCSCLPVRPQP